MKLKHYLFVNISLKGYVEKKCVHNNLAIDVFGFDHTYNPKWENQTKNLN